MEEYDRTSIADDALFQLADDANQQGRYVEARQKYLDLRKRYPKSELEAQAAERAQEIERPVLGLGVSRTHLPGTTIPAHLRARSIGGIDLTAYRLDPFELLGGGVLVRDMRALRPKGDKAGTWHIAVTDKGDYAWQDIAFEPPLDKSGVYLLEAVATGKAELVDDAVINISSLVLVQQQAAGKLVNYVASRSTVKPVEGAELRVARLKNDGTVSLLKTGKTDGKGLWVTTIPPRKDEGYQLLAVGRRGDEWILQDRGFWSWWQEREVRLHGYLYTDRPIYRPGNQVHFRGILRSEKDDDYSNLPGQKVNVTINDPRGQEVYKATLETDAYGTIGGELALAAEPTLGVYNVALELPGGGSAGGQFRVEEYRKPEFKVEVGKPVAEVRPGGAAAVPVKANYYFGAPVAGAELKYVVQRRPFFHWYWFPGPWDWFYAGWRSPPRPWWNQQVVTEGKATTDDKGETIIEFPTLADGNDYTYSVAVEVTDVTRRVVESAGSVTVTRDGFYLDAHTNQGLYEPSSLVTLQVHAQNADGQPVETAGMVNCYEMKFVPEKRNPQTDEVVAAAHYERGAKLWENKPFRTDPATGERALTFTAPADGHYELECRSPDTFDPKHDVVAKAFFWCASQAWKGRNYNHADLQLITEKDLYEKGARARILINSPVPDASVLLTIGAHDILSATVTTLQANSGVIELPIEDAYAPNVYVVATLVGPNNVYFAQKEILVPPTDQLLNVKVESDKAEFRPRTQGTFHVTTTDQNGKPVAAQVSLGISDDSVYAIQEELASPIGVFFYG
ncbi:MAG: hypothetical protein HYU66_18925, partial [Armatimonadetes bacterium]|nr:hypothetical protein [Armatimonadota bacterium]